MPDNTIRGVVANGLVVPSSPLPEGAMVDIHLTLRPDTSIGPEDLRKMPREQRRAILAAAAVLAEADYRDDIDLTDFAAFSEEERHGDESDAP